MTITKQIKSIIKTNKLVCRICKLVYLLFTLFIFHFDNHLQVCKNLYNNI